MNVKTLKSTDNEMGMWPWSEDRIPIIAFQPVPFAVSEFMKREPKKDASDWVTYDAEVKRLSCLIAQYLDECGFSAAITGDDYLILIPMCDALSKYNIGFIPQTAYLYTPYGCNDLIGKFKNRKNWVANLIIDEPQYWHWGDFQKGGDHTWDQLITSFQMMKYLGIANGRHTLPFFTLLTPFDIAKRGDNDEIIMEPNNTTGSIPNYH